MSNMLRPLTPALLARPSQKRRIPGPAATTMIHMSLPERQYWKRRLIGTSPGIEEDCIDDLGFYLADPSMQSWDQTLMIQLR